MRKIDIDSLSGKELIELNHKIVARLRFLHQMRSHAEMLDFRIGEKVRFRPTGHPELIGTVTRYNKKTVTVIYRRRTALERFPLLPFQRGNYRHPEVRRVGCKRSPVFRPLPQEVKLLVSRPVCSLHFCLGGQGFSPDIKPAK